MRETPLYQAHLDAHARIIDFHGWAMPVQYAGIVDETRRVREHVGLFDLCHMGRLVICTTVPFHLNDQSFYLWLCFEIIQTDETTR